MLKRLWITFALVISLGLCSFTVHAEEQKSNKERIKELQDQIVELKKEILRLQKEDAANAQNSTGENNTGVNGQNSSADTTAQTSGSAEEDLVIGADLVDDVEIVAQYILTDSLGWYTRCYLILKNNTSRTLDVKTDSVAYSQDGSVLGHTNGSLEALGPGCTSILVEAYETNTPIYNFDRNMSQKDSNYDSVIQNLSYEQVPIDKGALFTVTNNGNIPADFVEGHVLFFLGGNLVYEDSTYFTDDDSQIKPGASEREQITSYEQFDSMQIYFTGRHYPW